MSRLNLHHSTTIGIRILKGGWKIAESSDDSKYVKTLVVSLSIQGDPQNGYHLLMQPEGCFCADYHYQTKDEALEDAQELFGVAASSWIDV